MRALGKLPEEIILYGIEGSCFNEGKQLSEKIEAAANLVIEQNIREVVFDSGPKADSVQDVITSYS